jgi:hypothetical protein
MSNENIAKAFVAAQQGFSPALKDSNNPFFKSKYADLSTCVKAVIDALHENGIGLIQTCHESESGVIVETVFIHTSGETINCGKLHVPAAKNDPQGYGSALTYARRYSLMAACGIAPEDDDGNAATRPKPTAAPQPPKESGKSIGAADFEKLHPDRQLQIRELATEIIAEYDLYGAERAYDMYSEAKDAMDLIEEQTALRGQLPSPIRTAFGKIFTQRNPTEKAAA